MQYVTDYQKLITHDKVDLIFGPFSSLLTKPASVVAHRYGYALPEGAGGGPSVFTQGLNNVFDVSLPVANNLVSFAHYIARAARKSTRPETAAYATEDDPFTSRSSTPRARSWRRAGVKTVYYNVYPAETTDYTPIADADHPLAGAGRPHRDTAARHLGVHPETSSQQHYNPQALIATAGLTRARSSSTPSVARTREGVFVPNGWYPTSTSQNATMVKAYIAKYGGTPAPSARTWPRRTPSARCRAGRHQGQQPRQRQADPDAALRHLQQRAGSSQVRPHRPEHRRAGLPVPVAGRRVHPGLPGSDRPPRRQARVPAKHTGTDGVSSGPSVGRLDATRDALLATATADRLTTSLRRRQ